MSHKARDCVVVQHREWWGPDAEKGQHPAYELSNSHADKAGKSRLRNIPLLHGPPPAFCFLCLSNVLASSPSQLRFPFQNIQPYSASQ